MDIQAKVKVSKIRSVAVYIIISQSFLLQLKTPMETSDDVLKVEGGERSYGVLDLFRSPNLARKTLIITFIW